MRNYSRSNFKLWKMTIFISKKKQKAAKTNSKIKINRREGSDNNSKRPRGI